MMLLLTQMLLKAVEEKSIYTDDAVPVVGRP